MGYGRWDSSDWSSYTTTHVKGKTKEEVFTSRSLKSEFNPLSTVREARDSTLNPASVPIIVALDVTGSMGRIPHYMIQEGLGTLAQEILDRKPVKDPQIMMMAVGDAYHDRSPLQVTQFEADIRIAEQLKGLYLEGGGGGNAFESYNLPWYYAAMKTEADAFDKRNKKGYLFTVGDEECPKELLAKHVKDIIGDDAQTLSTKELLDIVKRKYEVYHVVVEEGSHFKYYPDRVKQSWGEILPQSRILQLQDYTKLSEVIVSAIQVNEGANVADVTKSWDGSTALVVQKALSGLPAATTGKSGGIVRL